MEALLDPSFIASTAAGGGVVWAVAKTHFHFIWREFERHQVQIKALADELKDLRQTRGDWVKKCD